MKTKNIILSVILALSLSPLNACTGISIKTEDNSLLQARTVEYGENNLNSRLLISPRGAVFSSLTPENRTNGLKWKAKYGFVGISMIYDTFVGEGLNEEGLSAGIFYFPHYGSLKSYDKNHSSKSLSDMELVKWVLSSFKSVDEVKKAIEKIQIVSTQENDGMPLPTGHWRIADKSGKNVVLEIEEQGKITFHDNIVGVLTNSPDYAWHVKNLNNYINLHSANAKDYTTKQNHKIFSFGVGTGSLGLPGDITPPSRFVRAFFYLNTLKTPQDSHLAMRSAFHILNNFDIPIGLEYAKEHHSRMPNLLSATQWTTASDLKGKIFYYTTMNDAQIRKIDLNKINFKTTKTQSLPLDEKEGIKELEIK